MSLPEDIFSPSTGNAKNINIHFQICRRNVAVCARDTRISWIRKCVWISMSFVRRCLIPTESVVPFRNNIPPLTRPHWLAGPLPSWRQTSELFGLAEGPHYKEVEWGHFWMGSTSIVTSAQEIHTIWQASCPNEMAIPSSSLGVPASQSMRVYLYLQRNVPGDVSLPTTRPLPVT